MVRHILRLASDEWLDEYGLTWLPSVPKIKLLPEHDLRKPYPLSWPEQDRLFRELPIHLGRMCLFKVNTGCREAEVCGLRWDWEVGVPDQHERLPYSGPCGQESYGPTRRAEQRREVRGGVYSRGPCGIHLCFSRTPAPPHQQHRVEAGACSCGATSGACSRSQAHVWTALARGRRELRGPAGLAGTQVREDYDALFGGRAVEFARRGQCSMRDRVPQNSRIGFAARPSMRVTSCFNGGPGRTRTYDQGIMSPLL